jgi:lysophospholipase L1-like esterase
MKSVSDTIWGIIWGALLFIGLFFSYPGWINVKAQASQVIRYVPIGDSYTIGTGVVVPGQSWPALLTGRLRAAGWEVQLVANPARAGWTTQDAIHLELPIFKESKPDFATLMIGTNDCARGMNPQSFRRNLTELLDAMRKELSDPKRLLVVNIPDFASSPGWERMSGGEKGTAKHILLFNGIIEEECRKRGLPVVDIYTVSQQMNQDPAFFSSDGLHPSAKGYAVFAQAVYPQAKRVLEGR